MDKASKQQRIRQQWITMDLGYQQIGCDIEDDMILVVKRKAPIGRQKDYLLALKIHRNGSYVAAP